MSEATQVSLISLEDELRVGVDRFKNEKLVRGNLQHTKEPNVLSFHSRDFSYQEMISFLEATGDPNLLHRRWMSAGEMKDVMSGRGVDIDPEPGKYVVIPGMFGASYPLTIGSSLFDFLVPKEYDIKFKGLALMRKRGTDAGKESLNARMGFSSDENKNILMNATVYDRKGNELAVVRARYGEPGKDDIMLFIDEEVMYDFNDSRGFDPYLNSKRVCRGHDFVASSIAGSLVKEGRERGIAKGIYRRQRLKFNEDFADEFLPFHEEYDELDIGIDFTNLDDPARKPRRPVKLNTEVEVNMVPYASGEATVIIP